MKWLRRLSRRSQEAELDAELRYHMQRQLQQYLHEGLPYEEARRRVRLEFGDLGLVKDECRDVRPLHWLSEFLRDVRLGFRSLGRERMFAASATGVLALGIGLSVAMFSVLNAVVLRPLPYARAAELVVLSTHDIAGNQPDGTSLPNFFDWRAQSRSFAGMTFFRRTHASQVTFLGSDAPVRAQEGLVGPEFFNVLGAFPLLGRTFSHEEFERGERVVVISEGLWQEQFGRTESVLGKTLSVAGEDHVVIGVMSASFQLPTSDTRFWRPLSTLKWWDGAKSARDGDGVEVIGRLSPAVTLQQARSEMSVIAARLREAHVTNRNRDVRVTPLFEHVVGARTTRGVWVGFSAVMSLLAIACANVGGLLATRTARRRHELAIRAALGAGRSRLVRQLIAEAVSLWAIAGCFGVLVSYAAIQFVLAYGPRNLPRLEQVRLDATALGAVVFSGISVVVLSGTLPALLTAQANSRSTLGIKDTVSLPRYRLQDTLVTAQIAGALMLVIGAVLLAESFLRAQHEDAGYPAEHVLIVRIDRPSVPGFAREAAERIRRLPGVLAVGGVKQFFLRRNPDQRVTMQGRASVALDEFPRLAVDAVTPGYFRSIGIDLLEGRDFEERDLKPGARVSIVNETMARRFWPGESAMGKRWAGGTAPPTADRWNTVIGVVKDMRREGLDVAPIAAAFLPDDFTQNFDLTVRASTNAEKLIAAVRSELRSIDPSLAISDIISAESLLSQRLGKRRFETQLLVAFALIALLLASAGLYVSLAYQVVIRTREIGIRAALGAQRRAVVGMIVGKGLRLGLIGTVLGVVGAAAAARVLQTLLYGTSAMNPVSYAVAVLSLLTVAGVAAWIPAQRAASIDPMTALREG